MIATEAKICKICPRACRTPRDEYSGGGFCRSGLLPRVARAAPHFWEEPCISGEKGSGAVFFSGCSMRCVFCQNSEISSGGFGKTVTPERLRGIFFELIDKGVHNINLVNPTHFADAVIEALDEPLPVPVVWNSGGYDSVETLRRLEGKIDIYLPDMKYSLEEPARKYSAAPDYPETADAAIREMFRQTGPYVLDENGMMKSGVIVRHLVLPENPENTYGVISWFSKTFNSGDALFSLMSQYTPAGDAAKFPELQRRLLQEEYENAVKFMKNVGVDDGFFQELSSAKEEYVPEFDLTGV